MLTHADDWNRYYADAARPEWDMDRATPVLAEVLDLALPQGLRPGGELAVPGCGYGHDAAELAARGFAVTGIDFAPFAIEGARARYGDRATWMQADWFSPDLGPWDAIFDHTCFVAMDPPRRPAYVAACADHLHSGGLWMAVLFHDVSGRPGPPHAVSPGEMRALAEPRFDVLHLGPALRSHPRRAGREFLLVARRKLGTGD
ncbi:methyltransferase domain-containing protein [Geothrix sp. 21YS21S-4]|uniref:methyltransferase domain-containing protein n=1 Tax=Geothrix sp. 21YS21S-4 TaxID=3068889 RepID=UPI0027B91057|nr:methyltransferase domain-containing protein [Geothrix sp. 21YS21S-4]